MTYDPNRHHRRSIRLKGYDYTRAGAYFVTIVCQDRTCLFGKVVDGMMQLNDASRMVQTVRDEIPEYYPGVDVDASIIMPNHMHGIVVLFDPVGAGRRNRPDDRDHTRPAHPQGDAPTKVLSLPDVVHRFKMLTTKRYTDGVKQMGWQQYNRRVWQRNYYEHIVRSEESLERIRNYILGNPALWDEDRENPDVIARSVR